MDVLVELRRASRRLVRTPAFTVTAALTIALSLSVLGALGSFWTALVVRSQPSIGDPERLVWIRPVWTARAFPYPTLQQHEVLTQLQLRTLEVAFYAPRIRSVQFGNRSARKVSVQTVSAEYFRVLRVPLAAGKGLADSSIARPAVVSWRFWKEEMDGSPDVLGRQLTIANDTGFVVAGVAPEGFIGPEGLQQADVWVRVNRKAPPDWGRMVARLRIAGEASSARRVARAEVEALWPQVVAQDGPRQKHVSTPTIEPLRGGMHPENVRSVGLIVGGVASICVLTLLLATANLASLVLTRAVARERDLSVKRAIGAQAWAVVAEPVLEIALLFLGACAAGILLARPVGAGLVAALNAPFPFAARVEWNLPTIALVTGFAFIAALLCAGGPAYRLTRTDPGSVLRVDAGASRLSRDGRRMQSSFLVAQLLVAFLLVGASATVALQSWDALVRDVGIADPESVVVAYMPQQSDSRATLATRAEALVASLRTVTGSRQSAFAYAVPGQNRLLRTSLGRTREQLLPARVNIVSPSFFEVAGISTVSGRPFNATDVGGSDPVVVLSSAAVERLFENRAPLASSVAIGEDGRFRATVVGVVADVMYDADDRKEPVAYVVTDQFDPVLGRETALFRVPEAQSAVRKLDSAMRAGAGLLAVRPPESIAQLVEDSSRGTRSLVTLVIVCMILATAIALLGVFGLVGYTVQQNRRETAVRLALGATPRRIAWEYSISSLRLTVFALLPGVIFGGLVVSLLAPVLGTLVDSVVLAGAFAASLLGAATVGATVLSVRYNASFDAAVLLRSD